MGYYDDINHDPREGCACDLCSSYAVEMDALADEHNADAIEHLDAASSLDTPAGTVAARRRHRPMVEEELRVASEGWWRLVAIAAEHRDLKTLRRLCGGQDPETAEDVDVWVALLAKGVERAPERSEVVTVAARPSGRL